MYCPSCGKRLVGERKFCMYCGKPVPEEAAIQSDAAEAETDSLPDADTPSTAQFIYVTRYSATSSSNDQEHYAPALAQRQAYAPKQATSSKKRRSGKIRQALGLSTLLLGIIILLISLVVWPRPSDPDNSANLSLNLVGKWFKNKSFAGTTATRTGDKLVDAFNSALTSWKCASADTLEFLTDGTVSATSQTFGSSAGSYEVIDGNRLKIDSSSGSVLWTFSFSYVNSTPPGLDPGEFTPQVQVLIIEGEAGCPDTQWKSESLP